MLYGYARVSTEEQASVLKTSLDEQERKVRGVALIRGEEDISFWRDEGVSGSIPLSFRPAGKAMLQAMQVHDILCASKLDRLFRNAEDALVTARQLQERGIGLILTDIGTDPVTENGTSKLLFGILAMCAEFERSRIIERIADGTEAKRRRGGYTGGWVPYGFRVEGRGAEARLVEHEREQAVITMVRNGRANGLSFFSIADALTLQGHQSRTGRPFKVQQLIRMMTGAEPVDKTAVR